MKGKLGVSLGVAVLGVLLSGLGFGWRARVKGMEAERRRIERERQRQEFALRPGRDWPTARGGLDMTGSTDEVIQPPLHEVWKTKLPSSGLSNPIVYKGRVYVTGYIRRGQQTALLALDGFDGRLLWTGSPGEEKPGNEASRPVAGCGIVCYTAVCGKDSGENYDNPQIVGQLYAFDAISGKLKWKQVFRGEQPLCRLPIPPIILPSGLVCYARIKGPWWELVAAKMDEGGVVWTRTFAGSPVYLGPYAEGVLYVTSHVSGIVNWEHRFWDGARYDRYRQKSTLTALNGRTGRIMWSSRFLRLEPGGWGDPGSKIEACGRDRILYGTSSGSVVAFDPRSRRWLWHRNLSELFYAVPVTVSDNLVISGKLSIGNKYSEWPFTAFNRMSGRRIWKRELSPYPLESGDNSGPRAPVVTGNILYAFGYEHAVAANVQTGEILWDCYDEYCQCGGHINVAVSKGRMFYERAGVVRALEGAQYQGAL